MLGLDGAMRNHRGLFLHRYTTAQLFLHALGRHTSSLVAYNLLVRPITDPKLRQLRPIRQALQVPDRFVPAVRANLCLAAHDDRLFRTGLYTEPTKDTAQHVDFKSSWVLLDLRIRMLCRLDVDTIGRARSSTHITGHAPRRPIFPRCQNVSAPIAI